MTRRTELNYKRYRIIAGEVGKAKRAVAYLDDRTVSECEGATVEAAIAGVRARLDEIDRVRHSRRKGGNPTVEEYREALEAIAPKITKAQSAMLKAHYHAKAEDRRENVPDRTMGAEELAKAAGYADYSSTNLHYGRLGRELADYLNYRPPENDTRGEPVWTLALATGEKSDDTGLWTWTMRLEVAEALRQLNMV